MEEQFKTNSPDFSSLGGDGGVKTLTDFLAEEDKASLEPQEVPDFSKQDDTPDLTLSDLIETPEEGIGDVEPKVPVKKEQQKAPEEKKPLVTELSDLLKEETTINYKSVVTKLIEDGSLEEIGQFETEEGEVSFDDMEITEDVFKAIIQSKIDSDVEKGVSGKVSIDKTSEFTKKLIEIESNGGSVQDALAAYEQIQKPLEGINLEDKNGQQQVLYLKYKNKGLDEADIINVIKATPEDKLEEKAQEAYAEMQTAYDKYLEDVNQRAIDNEKQRKTNLKKYRTSLQENLSKFELNKTMKTKLLDLATKENEGGFEMDRLYNEVRKDPQKVTDLLLFLANKEEYDKQITSKKTTEARIETFKTIKIVPKSKTGVQINKQKSSDDNLVDLPSFTN